MKKSLFFLAVFCFLSASGFSAEPMNYEAIAKSLSRSIEIFQKLMQPGPGYNVALRRDPMEPLVDEQGNVTNLQSSPQESREGLVVKGIVYSDKFKAALVDGEFYFPGDSVGPYQILEIKRDGLLIQDGNKTTFVPVDSNAQAEEKPSGRSG